MDCEVGDVELGFCVYKENENARFTIWYCIEGFAALRHRVLVCCNMTLDIQSLTLIKY